MSGSPHDPSYNQMETLDSQGLLGGDDVKSWPCLTILYHPDLRRIGEQAIIGQLALRKPVELSRRCPEFTRPGTPDTSPLRDLYLSRSPVRIERNSEERIVITPSPGVHLRVNEERVESSVTVPAASLQQGVLLQLSRRVILLLHTITLHEHTPRWELVGESAEIRQVRRQIAQVADLDVPVLIRGETGVGKERVAQAIHAASRRADRPCIAVNMAAISPGTAASELFGHARGAFTGAIHRNVGLFERADGGTLFLDEIGETPTSIQAMLLRALAEGTIMPVGGLMERSIDVRIIAATDASLEAADSSFRAALLYRLMGYEIRVPPLRERREDIPRLAMYFLSRELEEIGESWQLMPRTMSRTLWFPPELMLRLYHHDWPGNVRQLGNVVRQLVISSRGVAELRMDHSVAETLGEVSGPAVRPAGERRRQPGPARAPRDTREPSPDEVYEALAACDWVPGPAAERLGIPRSTLYKLIDKHPKIRKARDLSQSEIEECMRALGGDIERMAGQLKVSRRGLRLRMSELGVKHEARK